VFFPPGDSHPVRTFNVTRTVLRTLSAITGRRAQTAVMGFAAAAIVGGIGIANAVGDAPASAADA